MSHIFISYSKKNRVYARQLADKLIAEGFDVWIDDRIDYGDEWWEKIVAAIRDCAAFIIIMSPEAKTSKWVRRELALADEHFNKRQFPLLLEGDNWERLILEQYVDVRDCQLPPSSFFAILSRCGVPRQRKPGANVTQPDHSKPPFNINVAIRQFYGLKESEQFEAAWDLLDDIESSGKAPTFFKIGEFRDELRPHMEKLWEEQRRKEWEAAAEQGYETIRVMSRHDSPKRVLAALQAFWQEFPGYDPDRLEQNLRARPFLDIMLNPNVPPEERAEAGRQLADIGDPRPGVGLLPDGTPDIAWSEVIPAGPFQMGGDPEAYNAWEGAQFDLNYPFWIARYPVTYAQYEAFISAGGYQEKKYWTDAGWEWKGDKTQPDEFWNDPQWHIANHPVIGITWYEAYAFTQWLDTLRQGSRLALPLGSSKDCVLRLPTEAEWEKAARYPDGRKFPWGNDYLSGYANVEDGESNVVPYCLGRTSTVGIYPQGVNPAYGVNDLAGNVWEWCLSQGCYRYQFPEDNCVDEDSDRVVRGGSWYHPGNIARSASRVRSHPHRCNDNVGFRVVCSVPMK